MRPVLPPLLVFLACTGCAREWVRDYDGYLPDTEESSVSVFLVRDKRTGRPIEGAHVRYHEEAWPGRDGNWAPLLVEGWTDRYGLVSFPLEEDPGSGHWAVSAPGYAPTEEYGGLMSTDVELEPGRDLHGRLLGPTGEPLAGVELEHKVGCAHAPALARAHTDRDGRFVFRNVDESDITFADPRCQADYWSGGFRLARHGVTTYHTFPGATVRGRVVGPDGAPPEWAVVQSNTSARGPRALVDANGGFVLRGSFPQTTLWVYWDGGIHTVKSDYRPGGPILIRLGEQAEEELHAVTVSIKGNPDDAIPVHFDRVLDGRRLTVEWSPLHEVKIRVPPGAYRASAGDPWSRYAGPESRIEVPRAKRVTLVAHEQPRLLIEPPPKEEAADEEAAALAIQLEDRYWSIDKHKGRHLPAHAKAWLRAELGGRTYIFPIGPAEGGLRRVRAPLPRVGVKWLRFPGLSDGFSASLLYAESAPELDPDDDFDSLRLETYATGRRWLSVTDPVKGRALVPIDLPDRADAPIVVRDLPFEKPPPGGAVRVLHADGSPAKVSFTLFVRPDSPYYYDPEPDEDGVYRHPLLRDGAYIQVVAEGFAPRWERLRGDGPYAVRLGSAALVVDIDGLEDACILLDGVWHMYDETPVRLLGLRAGWHTLLVGARGRVPRIHRIRLREGEVRTITPELRRRE